MPTTITHTVIPSGGGDYSSLSNWESAQQRNLVTADEIARALCSSTGTADTAGVVVSGFTTDATRYGIIECEQTHGGVWNTSIYRLSGTGVSLNVSSNDFKVVNLQIETSGFSICCAMFGETLAGHLEVDNCIMRCTTGSPTSNSKGVEVGWHDDVATGFRMRNTILYDFYSGFVAGTDRRNQIHNVTITNCTNGFYASAATSKTRLKNCLAQDCTDGFLSASGWHGDSTNNCSDITSDAPGSNPSTGEVTFTDEGADNFTLSASDTIAKDLGADLSADAAYAVTDDIAGTARPQGSAYDIGASEVVAAAATRRVFVVS